MIQSAGKVRFDGRNNSGSMDLYTKEEAEKQSKALFNCGECYNYAYCANCTFCTDLLFNSEATKYNGQKDEH